MAEIDEVAKWDGLKAFTLIVLFHYESSNVPDYTEINFISKFLSLVWHFGL